MFIQSCQVTPSSDRSQWAAIVWRSAATVRVDRTRAVWASAGRAADATSPPPEKWNAPSSSMLSKLRARYLSPSSRR
jgi:hypothetical protein